MHNPRHIHIIGAGFGGLAAAFYLLQRGIKVSLYEADAEIGGLAGSFEIEPGVRLEKFYHHWFKSDGAIIELIHELGLADRLLFLKSRTGLFYANSIFRLSSPLDLLKFEGLPFIDRLRTGLMALYARWIKDWQPLEQISAEDWLIRFGGRRAYETIWKPLLVGKFGAEAKNVSAVWFWNKLKLRGGSRAKDGAEQLLYFDGGFQALSSALRQKLVSMGAELVLKTRVERIHQQAGSLCGLTLSAAEGQRELSCQEVLATCPIPEMLKIAPDLSPAEKEKISQIRFLGNVCLVLGLKRSLTSTYWLNVADPQFPFVALIEHTNFDRRENYAGLHIAYLSKYLPTSNQLFCMNDADYFDFCLPFIKRIVPEFSPHWVEKYWVWRAHYSQPVVGLNYGSKLPDFKTSIKGLWLCSMAQIYPEDRGTNYAVAYGKKIAAALLAEPL